MIVKYNGKKISLLRCPFCDTDPTVFVSKFAGKRAFWGRSTFRVSFENKNCIMVQTLCRPTLEQAAREWNHRPWNQVPETKEEMT